MLGLTLRLALSNLKKNHRLYLPYALMAVLSTAIAYIFASLAFHPDLKLIKGANGVSTVLAFGMIVVMLAVAIMVFYANGFVMKQRSKEFGVYSILGLEKKHLLLMTCLENLIFSVTTIAIGLALGMILDKLFYALLLKAIEMPVVLASTFQFKILGSVFLYLFAIFLLVNLFNIGKVGLSDSLTLVHGKKKGDRKGKYLWLQTLLGLLLLGTGYTLALSVTNVFNAVPTFFGATLLVIFGTYLLFQAGIITLLNWLKNRQTYYYKPENFVSISNLIFRMRKNALGLATITILSSMFLVTMVGGVNIYIGGKDYINSQNPDDFSIDVGLSIDASREQVQTWANQILEESQVPVDSQVAYTYQQAYFSTVNKGTIDFLNSDEAAGVDFSERVGTGLVIDQATYQQMTGESLDLARNQLVMYSKGIRYEENQEVVISNQSYQIVQVLPQNITRGYIPDHGSFLLNQYLVIVVADLSTFSDEVDTRYYMGYESSLSEEEQVDRQEYFLSNNFSSELWSAALLPTGFSVITLSYRAYALRSFFSYAGSLFFIGMLLSVVFFIAVVLVIYFKQISEGFEDRSRFNIMTKVGLDQDQTKQSIRKQLMTVFFLPIILAFVHLAFAYKMLSSILLSIGVVNEGLMLKVTLGICVVYLFLYILVYLMTTTVYRKMISYSFSYTKT